MNHDDADVQAALDAIAPENQPLFDRLRRLVLELHPDATMVLSYDMPTYVVGAHRLHVGVWKHGLSFYGIDSDFVDRHPELRRNKSTIQLSRDAAEGIDDDELRGLIRDVLPPQGIV